MFHALNGRSGLFILLILGCCLHMATCDDDAAEEEAPGTEHETEAPVENVPEDVNGDVDIISVEHTESSECLNPKNETKQKCCKSFPEMDESFMKCFMLHEKKMPKDKSDLPLIVKFLSCFIECLYKSKKYIGKGDSLNMKMVKADVAKAYKSDKRKQLYMTEVFEYCEIEGGKNWRTLKKNLAARAVFIGACKPYLMFVFICTMDYPVKVKCPYYMWKGSKENIDECNRLQEECER